MLAISFAVAHATWSHRPGPAAASAPAPAILNVTSSWTRADSRSTEVARESRPSSSVPDPSSEVARSTVSSVPETQVAIAEHLTGPAASNQPESDRQFLDYPPAGRFFVVRSAPDGKAEQRVAGVVDRTSHHGFSRISVPQGMEIDPRHPEEAVVFALLVKPGEVDRLRDQLKAALPDLLEESATDPGIVTQLADIGQARVFPPAPADVLISREDLALRTNVAGNSENAVPPATQSAHAAAASESQSGRPLEPAAPKPSDRSGSAGAAMSHSAPATDEKLVVLVWVCKPQSP
jgi:hypothetical protein